jgi:putative ATP-dependent endonuclease of OLD family
MGEASIIRRLVISRFRGIEEFDWLPTSGTNLILGGGDVGKTTVLEAVGLLLSPSNSAVVTEADYWLRDSSKDFVIEATMHLPAETGINAQQNVALPWQWNGAEAVLPEVAGNVDDLPMANDPVYRVRVRGTAELELVWEIVHPHEETTHFSSALRRKIGLVRLATEDRNDRDLRLVFGSALDRLFNDNTLRPKIGKKIAGLDLNDAIGAAGLETLDKLDKELVKAALPSGLALGLTSTQGLSIGALIGLLAKKGDVSLPLSSWGAGTRRMASLEIASLTEQEPSVLTIDEVERGLEPYRLRKLLKVVMEQGRQTLVTTHSPVAIASTTDAQLWFMDEAGKIGPLDRAKIGQQQTRDPETFLARVPVIAEGPTEKGLLNYLLEKALKGDPLDHGIRVCDGQGNEAVLGLLETLCKAGLKIGGLVDNEGKFGGRWGELKVELGDRLFQWEAGCTEEAIIAAIDDDKLPELAKDENGAFDGYRLRTLATRLGLKEKSLEAINAKLAESGETLRALIVAAASASTAGAPPEDAKEWKAHGRSWFKSEEGGKELAKKMVALGAWGTLEPQLRPLINAILGAAGRPALEKLDL